MSQIDPQYQYDPDSDETLDDNDSPAVRIPRDQIRAMERDAKSARQAQAAASAATRELAFVKAGVDTDSKLGKLLLASYDGEMDPVAIKSEWEDIGGIKPPASSTETPSDPTGDTGDDDIVITPPEGTQERQGLASGAQGDTGEEPNPDPRKVALQAGHDAVANGAPHDEAMGVMLNRLAGAAAAGDERVIWRPGRQ